MSGTGRLDALLDAYDNTQAQRYSPEEGSISEGEAQERPGSAPPNHRKRSRHYHGEASNGRRSGVHMDVDLEAPRFNPQGVLGPAGVPVAYQGAKPPTVSGKEVDEISDFLSYICSGSTVSNMHVEARLGRLEMEKANSEDFLGEGEEQAAAAVEGQEEGTQRFINGTRQEDFQYILSFLEQDDQKECAFRDWTEYIYDHEKGTLCLSYDNETMKMRSAVYENRRTNLDLATPHLPYDCRVSLSTKESAPPEKSPRADFKRKIEKKRWSFYKQRNIWKIDLTEMHVWTHKPSSCPYSSDEEENPFLPEEEHSPRPVSDSSSSAYNERLSTITNDDGLYLQNNAPKYEIRFELMPDVLQSLVHTDRGNLQYIAAKFWQTIQFFSRKRHRVPGQRAGRARIDQQPLFRQQLPVNNASNPPSTAIARHPRRALPVPRPDQPTGLSPLGFPGSPSPSPSSQKTLASARGTAGALTTNFSRSSSRSPSLSPATPSPSADFFASMERSASNAYSAAAASLKGEPFGQSSSFSPPDKDKRVTMDEASQCSFPFPEVKVKWMDAHTTDELRRTCLRIIFGPGKEDDGPNPHAKPSFPGPLPVNFNRRHWKAVQNKPYLVSEKTDGVRFMLLINDTGVYLTGRTFDFFKVQGYDQLIPLMASDGPTLLDGEMVHHQSSKRLFYLIFDAVCVNGVSHTKENLMGRLKQVRDLVVVRYREAVDKGTIKKSDHPFVLIGKQFFEKKMTKKVFDHIRKDKESGDYFYRDDKRHHKTDGIIFTPNEAYPTSTVNNAGLFKWKYPEKSTVDFKLMIKRPRHATRSSSSSSSSSSASSASSTSGGAVAVGGRKEYWLAARGRSNQGDIECDIAEFSSSDRQRLKQDMKRYNINKASLSGGWDGRGGGGAALGGGGRGQRNLIVECYYDKEKGKWRYMAIRMDKTQPNNIKTAFNAIIALAEDVTKEELIYRTTKTPKNDEWRLLQKTSQRTTTTKPTTISRSSSFSSAQVPLSEVEGEVKKQEKKKKSSSSSTETPPSERRQVMKKRKMMTEDTNGTTTTSQKEEKDDHESKQKAREEEEEDDEENEAEEQLEMELVADDLERALEAETENDGGL